MLALRRLVDRLEGLWLGELAAVDAHGAAGADQATPAPSTASWLRNRLHLSPGAAHTHLRTARALFRGPLAATAQALTAGELSPAHASVLAAGTHDLPHHTAAEAEPVLVAAARRLDPPRLRRVIGHLRLVADPEGADRQAERRHAQRGLWLAATLEGMVAVDGLLEAEAGQSLLAALEPLARPASAADDRSGPQRRADALTELARRALEGGQLPQTGGVRPHLNVTVDLDSLLGHPHTPGGPGAVVGRPAGPDPSAPRHAGGWPATAPSPGWWSPATPPATTPTATTTATATTPTAPAPLLAPRTDRSPVLRAGQRDWRGSCGRPWPCCPRSWVAPQPTPGRRRTSRVVTPAQRSALAVRDGGCVFPDCDRPLAWCEGHHLVHWLDGGPTDLANLALLCRAHH